ncbi:MAG TPA: TetR/AcrR family transcriptional regulator [Candidatus Stackebrandtia excrementipullorum]|nr:TetR/AcrR family transcriptional regulator [Candidatus Stackebrandtia excrementipullorum]
MTTRPDGTPPDRERTLTEQARRRQLIDVTIGLVAERGYSQTSLARIAEGAGLTKAAVLYHFPTKQALVQAAHGHVLDALTGDVAAAVESAPPADGPAVYVQAMVRHLHEHPRHTRMIIEAMPHADAQHRPEDRWGPLAQIIEAAAQARGTTNIDARTLALIIGGAVDALVNERLHDPHYDVVNGAEQLALIVEATLSV